MDSYCEPNALAIKQTIKATSHHPFAFVKSKETKTAFLCVILADYSFYVLDKDRKTLSSNRLCVLKVEKHLDKIEKI